MVKQDTPQTCNTSQWDGQPALLWLITRNRKHEIALAHTGDVRALSVPRRRRLRFSMVTMAQAQEMLLLFFSSFYFLIF